MLGVIGSVLLYVFAFVIFGLMLTVTLLGFRASENAVNRPAKARARHDTSGTKTADTSSSIL